jgi:hypothetical protein
MNIAWFMYYGNYSEDGMFDVCIMGENGYQYSALTTKGLK